MPIMYDKLFKLLKAHGYNTTRIRKENLLGQRTLTAIKNGTGGIDHRTIEKLCGLFYCQPNDLMEYIPDEEAETTMVVRIISEGLKVNQGYVIVPLEKIEASARRILEKEPPVREHYLTVISAIRSSAEKDGRTLLNLNHEERGVLMDLISDFDEDYFQARAVMGSLKELKD